MDHQFIYLDEINSTNTYLKELIQIQKRETPLTVYSGFQTAGRGQRGNSWESEKGLNLSFSTVLFPSQKIKASDQFAISETISLAIKAVLDKYVDSITIKWPNDIYWRDKKIAGILIENTILGDYIESSIIGVGLNINQKQFLTNAPNPVSLYQITGEIFDIEEILHQIIYEFYALVKDIKTTDIHNLYMKSLFRLGGYYPFKDQYQVFKASIQNVRSNGMLELLLENGTNKEYAFKEVQFII